jgi:hypothetical protein
MRPNIKSCGLPLTMTTNFKIRLDGDGTHAVIVIDLYVNSRAEELERHERVCANGFFNRHEAEQWVNQHAQRFVRPARKVA